MTIFDSHCHLYWDEEENSVADQLRIAADVGVVKFMCVGTNATTSARCQEISAAHPQVISSLGIHPNDVGEPAELDDKLALIKSMSAQGEWHAIGETGLDFFHKRGHPEAQAKSLLFHLDLADELGVPTIIHCRNAIHELVPLLEKRGRKISGVMHCFSEGPEFVRRLLDLGMHFSFAGNVSYPKSEPIRESVRCVPLNRLLVETDAPFLAPQPKRGKKNQSAYIVHTLEAVAIARDQTAAEISQQVFDNTCSLFQF
ncbi:MAG: TatD DNase family protein [Myxococcota bacterium]|jgi:TatD DNase family protein